MRYVVDVNGERITVELDGAFATVEGERLEVDLCRIEGTPMHLVRVGEHVHRVVARRGATRGSWQLDVDGVRVATESLDERMRTIRDLTAAASEALGPAPLLAPMPGLVVRVNVAPGDVVATGQGLVVVEAMKMENEIRAAAPGIVLQVKAIPGAAVEKGAILVELGPLPD